MQRIVLLQQSGRHEELLLRAVADTAARLNAEVAGLFIEDIDLFHLAGMPFACEVCFPSATRRELSIARLEDSLRVLAAKARRALESVARRAELRTSFRVARGSVFAQLLAAASDCDIVIAGSLARSRSLEALTLFCRASIAPHAVADLLRSIAPRVNGIIHIVLLDRGHLASTVWERDLLSAIEPLALVARLRVLCPKDEPDLERMLRT
ncbi:MAG: hypothetical protein ACKVQK_02295 [Burkholderiales bacterium]